MERRRKIGRRNLPLFFCLTLARNEPTLSSLYPPLLVPSSSLSPVPLSLHTANKRTPPVSDWIIPRATPAADAAFA